MVVINVPPSLVLSPLRLFRRLCPLSFLSLLLIGVTCKAILIKKT